MINKIELLMIPVGKASVKKMELEVKCPYCLFTQNINYENKFISEDICLCNNCSNRFVISLNLK